MGAHLSCMYVAPSPANGNNQQSVTATSGVVKLVLACDGHTYELAEPVKVAEIMLEFPNHFVTELDADGHGVFSFSKRISPLPADHDVQLRHIYLLLPMHRLNTRLSADELQLISAALSAVAASTGPISLVGDGDITMKNCGCAAMITGTSIKAPHTTRKVTPLSAQQFHEAALMSSAMEEQGGGSSISIAKSYSVPILELLQDDDGADEDMDFSPTKMPLQLQNVRIMRSRSWTPKLETIFESSHHLHLKS